MRVLVISSMYPSSYDEVTGVFVHEQVRALEKKGVEVRVVSPTPWTPWPVMHLSKKWKARSEILRETTRDGVVVYSPRYLEFPQSRLFASKGRRMRNGIKALVESIQLDFPVDLVHAHPAFPTGYATLLLGEVLRCPFVITVHGGDFHGTVRRGACCQSALARALHGASQVMVVSHKLQRFALSAFGLKNTVVVPNGVDPEKTTAVLRAARSRYPPAAQIVSVSRLVVSKGVDLNLRAVQRLRARHPGIRYVVVGDGPEGPALRDLVRRLHIGDCVEFAGQAEQERALEYMTMGDVFCLPSWEEGFGLVYLEAMACGKPVIGCRREGVEDFVEHGVTGLLIEPRSVDSLVDAMDYLLTHQEEAEAMGERARRHVLENYSWAKNAERTISVYKEALSLPEHFG